ncbi:MAG: hypothetical protein H8D80_02660 [Proteobacteria bacterium]|nr:hypothetical protein [Pseudomonadota bacterium]
MIKETYIKKTIDRAFDGLDIMLGVYRRTRLDDGTFKPDDKSTPNINEAWKSGKSPKKKKVTKKKAKKTK